MMAENPGILITRAASALAGAAMILWPVLAGGAVGVFAFIFAAPFVLAALAPRTLGPYIGKGVLVVATLAAFYDPPSSIGFFPNRFFLALPFFALGMLLAVPTLSEMLGRMVFRSSRGEAEPS